MLNFFPPFDVPAWPLLKQDRDLGECSLRSETTRISRVVPCRNEASQVRSNYCWLVGLSYLLISECPVKINTHCPFQELPRFSYPPQKKKNGGSWI